MTEAERFGMGAGVRLMQHDICGKVALVPGGDRPVACALEPGHGFRHGWHGIADKPETPIAAPAEMCCTAVGLGKGQRVACAAPAGHQGEHTWHDIAPEHTAAEERRKDPRARTARNERIREQRLAEEHRVRDELAAGLRMGR